MNNYRICYSTCSGDKWITLRAANKDFATILAKVRCNGKRGWYLKKVEEAA